MSELSRREFVALTVGGVTAAPLVDVRAFASAAITAREIVDRIKAKVGVEWKDGGVDGIKVGDSSTIVTGIATTALATMEVLGQAVKARANLVITCEPTFYSKADSAAASTDPVFSAKQAFIAKHNLVVFRFSDHWRQTRPDPLVQGFTNALGWSPSKTGDDPARVAVRETTLGDLAGSIKKTLASRGGIRVIGAPETKVRTVGILPGSTPIQASLRMLPGVDAIVAGEIREWESAEYVRDAVAAGGKKGLILIGRIMSESPGMNECATWLKTIVPEVAATWIPVTDPYWRPL